MFCVQGATRLQVIRIVLGICHEFFPRRVWDSLLVFCKELFSIVKSNGLQMCSVMVWLDCGTATTNGNRTSQLRQHAKNLTQRQVRHCRQVRISRISCSSSKCLQLHNTHTHIYNIYNDSTNKEFDMAVGNISINNMGRLGNGARTFSRDYDYSYHFRDVHLTHFHIVILSRSC